MIYNHRPYIHGSDCWVDLLAHERLGPHLTGPHLMCYAPVCLSQKIRNKWHDGEGKNW